MGSYKVNLDRIRQALHGQRGDDQRRIAEAGLRVVDLLWLGAPDDAAH